MKRGMVIIVVALIVGVAAYILGVRMGKRSAMKAINGDTTTSETEDDATAADAAAA